MNSVPYAVGYFSPYQRQIFGQTPFMSMVQVPPPRMMDSCGFPNNHYEGKKRNFSIFFSEDQKKFKFSVLIKILGLK